MPRATILLAALALLAGCGEARKAAPVPPPPDAAIVDALAAPIMTDPDLMSLNDGFAAIAVGGPVNSALPPIDRSEEAKGRAREAAARLLGDRPGPLSGGTSAELSPMREAVTAAQMALAAKVGRSDCADAVRYSARWAAMLPEPLQVYPRGAVQEAAGSDAPGCGLRVVHFRTPIAAEEVLAFYDARLRAAGWPAGHEVDGDDHVLRGNSGGTAYAIYVRGRADGLTAADIVVAG